MAVRSSGTGRTSEVAALALALTAASLFAMAYAPLMQAQTFHVLHEFTGSGDGAAPLGLTLDSAGTIYGVAHAGGRSGTDCYEGCGVAFRLSRHGSGWLFGVLHTFEDRPDGAGPAAPMVFGSDGALYGSTVGGGLAGLGNNCHHSGCGTIFRLQPPATVCGAASCPWVETVLYRFTGGADGSWPDFNDAAIFDSSGNLYATANYGGDTGGGCSGGPGCGVVFELTPLNGGWVDTVLYTFEGGTDGANPVAGVIIDHSGNVYGTTSQSTVYELTHSQSGWTNNVLLMTEDTVVAGVIFDQFGHLLGATENGGVYGGGSAFKMIKLANGRWTSYDIYDFAPSGEPYYPGPAGTLLLDRAGNLYGTTSADGAYGLGSVFKLSSNSDGFWTYTDLHDFTGGADGSDPSTSLVIDQYGNLYGTAYFGGIHQSCSQGSGCGVLFEITSN